MADAAGLLHRLTKPASRFEDDCAAAPTKKPRPLQTVDARRLTPDALWADPSYSELKELPVTAAIQRCVRDRVYDRDVLVRIHRSTASAAPAGLPRLAAISEPSQAAANPQEPGAPPRDAIAEREGAPRDRAGSCAEAHADAAEPPRSGCGPLRSESREEGAARGARRPQGGARGRRCDRGREPGPRPRVGQGFGPSRERSDQDPMSVKDITTGRGYKITEPTKREDAIEREVRGLLNKISPDNQKTIVNRLASVDMHKVEELEHVIRIIFSKALAEPFFCETYADMVFALSTRYPEFAPEHEGEKAQSFTRILLNTCQKEYEDEKQMYLPDDRRRKLALMKFIGNLFLYKLLAVKVIGQVVHDLIGIKEVAEGPIQEHMIECACELLQAIGQSLETYQVGPLLVNQFSCRLEDLKKEVDPATGSSLFSKRIQFQIQDLIDLRDSNWKKKTFKELAKTKDEVRKVAAREAHRTAMSPAQAACTSPSYIEEPEPYMAQTRRRQAEDRAEAETEARANNDAVETAKRDAEAKAQKEQAEEKAKTNAEDKAKGGAEARAKTEAGEKAKREAEDLDADTGDALEQPPPVRVQVRHILDRWAETEDREGLARDWRAWLPAGGAAEADAASALLEEGLGAAGGPAESSRVEAAAELVAASCLSWEQLGPALLLIVRRHLLLQVAPGRSGEQAERFLQRLLAGLLLRDDGRRVGPHVLEPAVREACAAQGRDAVWSWLLGAVKLVPRESQKWVLGRRELSQALRATGPRKHPGGQASRRVCAEVLRNEGLYV